MRQRKEEMCNELAWPDVQSRDQQEKKKSNKSKKEGKKCTSAKSVVQCVFHADKKGKVECAKSTSRYSLLKREKKTEVERKTRKRKATEKYESSVIITVVIYCQKNVLDKMARRYIKAYICP